MKIILCLFVFIANFSFANTYRWEGTSITITETSLPYLIMMHKDIGKSQVFVVEYDEYTGTRLWIKVPYEDMKKYFPLDIPEESYGL